MDNNNEEAGMWGDDDDDLLLFATQIEKQLSQQFENTNKQAGYNGITVPSLSAVQAAQVFESRRESLQQQNQDFTHDSTSTSKGLKGATLNTSPINDNKARAHNEQIQLLRKQIQTEKSKKEELSKQLMKAQGEGSNLRRQVDQLRQEQKDGRAANLNKISAEKQKHEEQIRKLNKELEVMRTNLRKLETEQTNAASKAAMYGVCGGGSRLNRSVGGGAKSPGQSISPTLASQKFKSDPDLFVRISKMAPQPQSQKSSNPPITAEKCVEAAIDDNELIDVSLIAGVHVYAGKTLPVPSLEILSKRSEIIQNIKKLINLELLDVEPVLKHIEKVAPYEIMTKFAPGPQIKTCFPGVVDSIFLCGAQDQKKRESAENPDSEYEDPKYPDLPTAKKFQNERCDIDLNEVVITLQDLFVNGNTWMALRNVKEQMKKLLEEFQGDRRFQLYRRENLELLWHLLTWTSHLWEFVQFEDELKQDEILKIFGKELWIRELKEWTGLILKIDYRDFYVHEIEVIIRGLSLSILESIMTSGYFEESQKRYEILYCILKDTLIKDHIRSDRLLRKCLTIVTWSVPKMKIFNYLCLEDNSVNCLARIFGDYVLKCFRETKSPYDAAVLLVHYLNLLDTLGKEKHHDNCGSPIARLDRSTSSPSSRTSANCNNPSPNCSNGGVEPMDIDNAMMCTQFADLGRYKCDEGVKERVERFNRDLKISYWINPNEWEIDPEVGGEDQRPCQCRRALVGNVFIMLQLIVESWKAALLEHEKRMEAMESFEQLKLKKFMEERAQLKPKMTGPEKGSEEEKRFEKMQSLRKFVSEKMKTCFDHNEDVLEVTWDVLLQEKEKSDRTNQISSVDSDNTPSWIREEKQRPENIFDYIMRRAILLMLYCKMNANNFAITFGSESFVSFTFLEQDYRFYGDKAVVTELEKILLAEDDEGSNTFDKKKCVFYDEEVEDTNPKSYLPKYDPDFILADLLPRKKRTNKKDHFTNWKMPRD